MRDTAKRPSSRYGRRIRASSTAPDVYKRQVPCKLEFYFDKTDRDVTCDAQAVYGERRYPLLDSPARDEAGPLRDEKLEGRARRLVKQYFDTLEAPPSIMLSDETAVADLCLLYTSRMLFSELLVKADQRLKDHRNTSLPATSITPLRMTARKNIGAMFFGSR